MGGHNQDWIYDDNEEEEDEVNRPLIEARFMDGTARTAVVQELHELMKVARQVLAA